MKKQTGLNDPVSTQHFLHSCIEGEKSSTDVDGFVECARVSRLPPSTTVLQQPLTYARVFPSQKSDNLKYERRF